VTRWDDPAVTADNGGVALPPVPVVPVVDAGSSGESFVATSWLADRFPADWAAYGGSRPTSFYPRRDGQLAVDGTDAVVTAVRSGHEPGAIALVPAAYPLTMTGLPVAAVTNAAGRWVVPTAHSTWLALARATSGPDGVDLTPAFGASDPDAYPLPYVAQLLVPTGERDPRMTTVKRQTLADFLAYAVCQGQEVAGAYGDVPLPAGLAGAAFDQVAALGAADPALDVSGRDLAHCSRASLTEAPAAPTIAAATPTVSGLAKVGLPLTARANDGRPGVSYDFAWTADGRPIAGATGPTYVPRTADVGARLSVTATPYRTGSVGLPATSERTLPVVGEPPAPVVTPAPGGHTAGATVVRAPSRHRAGRATVVVPTADGTRPATLVLRHGARTVRVRLHLRFTDGRAHFTVRRLPVTGRWRATLTVRGSAERVTTRFTVRVRR
jgi:phosphate transport system substrate-binding protein